MFQQNSWQTQGLPGKLGVRAGSELLSRRSWHQHCHSGEEQRYFGFRECTSGMGGEVEAFKSPILVLLFEGQEWAGFRPFTFTYNWAQAGDEIVSSVCAQGWVFFQRKISLNIDVSKPNMSCYNFPSCLIVQSNFFFFWNIRNFQIYFFNLICEMPFSEVMVFEGNSCSERSKSRI